MGKIMQRDLNKEFSFNFTSQKGFKWNKEIQINCLGELNHKKLNIPLHEFIHYKHTHAQNANSLEC